MGRHHRAAHNRKAGRRTATGALSRAKAAVTERVTLAKPPDEGPPPTLLVRQRIAAELGIKADVRDPLFESQPGRWFLAGRISGAELGAWHHYCSARRTYQDALGAKDTLRAVGFEKTIRGHAADAKVMTPATAEFAQAKAHHQANLAQYDELLAALVDLRAGWAERADLALRRAYRGEELVGADVKAAVAGLRLIASQLSRTSGGRKCKLQQTAVSPTMSPLGRGQSPLNFSVRIPRQLDAGSITGNSEA
jgi:hypothetical protein